MTDTVVRTIEFVDLAGFTALSEAHGDTGAADVAGRLFHLTRQALDPGVEIVKLVGASDRALLDSVERLIAACRVKPDFPMLCGGIYRRPAVRVDRDYFGPAVNLAARDGGPAASGQILLTAEVAAVVRATGLPATALGPVRLRGIPDPVCQMCVQDPVGRRRHDGRHYVFCSPECLRRFLRDTRAYTAESAEGERAAIGVAVTRAP